MVKPKLKTEQRSNFDKRKITVIETEHGNMYSNIPEEDFELLMDLYDSLPHQKLQDFNWQFVSNIDSRIYAEWCMNTEWKRHSGYEGEGFTEFVREETHFRLVRNNYQWNKKEKRFENLNDEQYQQARQRVLGGLTLRAIELFSDWNNVSPPARGERFGYTTKYSYDDQRNLRSDLKDYI